jgi:Asp-tRNA(Asn)/Glu-tRNA(Gln) amidotransferase A subunit family amidase
MVDNICRLNAATLSTKLHDGEITAEQLARACLARITAREADVRAWSYVDPDAVIGKRVSLTSCRHAGRCTASRSG